MSGGQAGAVNGVLTVMCGGDPAPFDAMRPVAMAYSRAVTRIGEAGAGQLAKMVNQVAIAGLVQGLAEALAFGQRAGLDMPLVLDVIGKMCIRDRSLFDLYEARHITYDDALRNADSVNDLRLQIKLQSQRARSNDLAAGTEHMRVV